MGSDWKGQKTGWTSGVTDGDGITDVTDWQAKRKNWDSSADILIFSMLLVFSKWLFFAFFGVFSFSMDIHDIRIHYHFLTVFFLSVGW